MDVSLLLLLLISGQWNEKARITLFPVHARGSPSAAAFTNHRQWLSESRGPSKTPGAEARLTLRVLDCKESPAHPFFFFLFFFTALDPLKANVRAAEIQELKTHHSMRLTLLRVTEQPLSTFSFTETDGKQLDNISLFQTAALLSVAQRINNLKIRKKTNEQKILHILISCSLKLQDKKNLTQNHVNHSTA